MGFSPEVFSKALINLHNLNNSSFKINKFDEKFQTHPTLVKRLSYINKNKF